MNTRVVILFLTLALCISHSHAAGIADNLVGYWPLDGNGEDLVGQSDAELAKYTHALAGATICLSGIAIQFFGW